MGRLVRLLITRSAVRTRPEEPNLKRVHISELSSIYIRERYVNSIAKESTNTPFLTDKLKTRLLAQDV